MTKLDYGQEETSTRVVSSSGSTPVALKAVIFDIDGTLADSWKLGFDATNKVLQQHGIPTITSEVYHEGTRYTTPDRLARHAGLLPGDGDEYLELGTRLGRAFDDLYIGMVNTETAGFYPGIEELLSSIQPEIHLGALTNAAVGYAHAVLTENSRAVVSTSAPPLSLYHRFGSIQGADTVPKPKPYPDGLWQVCRELRKDKGENVLKPCECVYIGDSPSDGVAALAADMYFIGVTWGSHSKESLLSKVVVAANDGKVPQDLVTICDSVDELKHALKRFSLLQ